MNNEFTTQWLEAVTGASVNADAESTLNIDVAGNITDQNGFLIPLSDTERSRFSAALRARSHHSYSSDDFRSDHDRWTDENW